MTKLRRDGNRYYIIKKVDTTINELFNRFGKIILLTRKKDADRIFKLFENTYKVHIKKIKE